MIWKRQTALALLVLAAMLPAATTFARTFATQDETLARAFPSATVERISIALSETEIARIEEICGEKPTSSIIFAYRANRDGKTIGTAYFDVHKVRTLPATVMITVDEHSRIGRIEVLSFSEPVEYMASERWNAQFAGKKLDENLQIKRDITTIAGASLTARATTRAARRILATHQIIAERAQPTTPPLP